MADNLNISPDMIENLVNMLKNTNQNETSSTDNNSAENAANFGHSDSNNNSNSNNNNINIDFETIIKIKSMIENINNSNDQNSKLLYSLKPYLRKSRQEKLDQYINILKISQISKFFNKKGDEN